MRSRNPGVRDVVLGGLCSGAEDALRFAETDPGITGVVMIDPFAYRTAGWEWRHLAHRAARRALRAVGVYEPIVGTSHQVVRYEYIEQANSTRMLKTLIARKARVHFIYTGGQLETFNHPGQLKKMFPDLPFQGRVTLDYFSHLDHTQLLDEDRRQVANAIGTWMRG